MSESDGRFSLSEFAALTGLPEEILRSKIRGTLHGQAFYSIKELADRWRCSRGTVYNRLRAERAKVLDFSIRGRRGRKAVASADVFQIESKRIRRLA